ENRTPLIVERDEADAALDDQRVAVSGDHMAEAHAPDGIGGEPRFHPHLDVDAVERDDAAKRPRRFEDELRSLAHPTGQNGVVLFRCLARLALVSVSIRPSGADQLLPRAIQLLGIEREIARRTEHTEDIPRAA